VTPVERFFLIVEQKGGRMMKKTRITGVVLGVLMLGLTVSGCGTLVGGAVGAGAGAGIAAGTGHSAKKGALIGGGAGAATGAVYDILH